MKRHHHPQGKFSVYAMEDFHTHQVYYGQTVLTLQRRLGCHHSRLMAWSHPNSAMQYLHDKDGDVFEIALIQEFDTRAEALALEGALIKANPNCLNRQHRRAKRKSKRKAQQ